jgi:hypothetical protein
VTGLIKWEFEYTLFAFQDELVDRLLSIKDKIFLKPNNDYKKGIKTESRNQCTSYALSKLSIIFFSTLAVKQNEHNCKRDPIYSECM